LEIAETFILCRHQAYKTHIKSIAIFIQSDNRVDIARGKFPDKGSEKDMIRLEIRNVNPASGGIYDHEGETAPGAECHLCVLQRKSPQTRD
jgi:hypothetical protein